MDRRSFIKFGAAFGGLALICAPSASDAYASGVDKRAGGVGRVVRTDEEWRRLLTPEQYEITRRAGTEAPYTSPLNKAYSRGTYLTSHRRKRPRTLGAFPFAFRERRAGAA